MLAARVHAFGEPLRVEEVPRPEPGPGEVVVRVAAAGVSAGMRNLLGGRRASRVFQGGAGGLALPHIPGYQGAGHVAGVGPGVSGWRDGDRVVINGLLTCRQCAYCREGRDNLCPERTLLGWTSGSAGTMAEYVRVPQWVLHRLPEAIRFALSTLVSDCGGGVHGLARAGFRPGDSLAVFGCGPLGLAVLLAGWGCGASRIVALDPIAGRRVLAQRLGAEAVDPGAADAPAEVRARIGEEGASVAVEAAGVPEAIQGAAQAVRPGGAVVLLGVTESLTLTFPHYYREIFAREIRFVPAYAKPDAVFARTIALLAHGRIPTDGLPVEEFSLRDVNVAVERANDPGFAGRVVVTP